MPNSIEEAPVTVVKSTCAGCDQTDDHPKQVIHVGTRPGWDGLEFHPKDLDQDGYLEYHLDCPGPKEAAKNPAHVAAAKSGLHGDALREHILSTKEA